MKPRTFWTVLIAVVLGLLALTGWGARFIWLNNPLALAQGGVSRMPQTASLVPGRSPLMVSLLVNPARLEAFTQLAVQPQRRRRTHQELADLEQSLLAKTGLDYRSQVQPWLGEEVSLAVTSLDYDQNPDNGAQPGYLLVVHSRDPELSREFLQLSYSTAAIAGNTDLVFDRYQGVKITYKQPLIPVPNSSLLASALVGDYVLFANHPQVLRQSLNSLQVPPLNLSHAPAYQHALATLTDPHVGIVYANFPALSAWLTQHPQPTSEALDQTLTIALSLQANGLLAKTALTGVTDSLPAPLSSSSDFDPSSPLVALPVNSGIVVEGEDLAQTWQQIVAGLPPQSPLQQIVQHWLEDSQQTLGIDVTQTIFAWVQGRYQLVLLPQPTTPQTDWIFAADVTDPDITQTALAQLNQAATDQGYQATTLEIQGKTINAWTGLAAVPDPRHPRLETEVKGVYIHEGDRLVLASSLAALTQVLQPESHELRATAGYAQAMSSLDSDSYLYLDWQSSKTFLSNQLPLLRVLNLSLKPLFDNLRTLTMHWESTESTVKNAEIYWNFGVNTATLLTK